MTVLPDDTVLGVLRHVETLVYFDGDQVLVAASETGALYVAGWADEATDSSLWLYLRVSPDRLTAIKTGGIALRDAFLLPEDRWVYRVVIHHRLSDGEDVAVAVRPAALQDEWLPEPDFRLDIPVATLQAATSAEELARKARSEHRTRLRLEVELPEMFRTEAPTRTVGELLILTQNVYDNLGLAIAEDEPPQAGRIPVQIAYDVESDVVETRAASFVLELGGARGDDLFGGSLFADVTKLLIELLAARRSGESLSVGLAALRPRGAKSFRRFVQGLANTGGDVTVGAAGSAFDYVGHFMSSQALTDFAAELTRLAPDGQFEEIRGRMRLYRADSARRDFGLLDTAADLRFEGKVDDAAYVQVSRATLDRFYDVVIASNTVLDEMVGSSKTTYVLRQLSDAGDDAPGTTTDADSLGPPLSVADEDFERDHPFN